jgi:hypothetical protein
MSMPTQISQTEKIGSLTHHTHTHTHTHLLVLSEALLVRHAGDADVLFSVVGSPLVHVIVLV